MKKSDELLLPYGDIFYELLRSIHKGLWYCYSFEQNEQNLIKKDRFYKRKYLTEKDELLESYFKPFEKAYPSSNKHIRKGLPPDSKKKFGIYPRISKLVIQEFNNAQLLSKKANSKAVVLPSPLFIIYQFLTVPSEAQSGAYPLILCRSMLFIFLGLHPSHPDIYDEETEDFVSKYPNLEVITEKEVLESISSFRNYINIQLRWPDKRKEKETEKRRSQDSKSARINFLIGHFLAMKGIAHLWFLEEEEKEKKGEEKKGKENLTEKSIKQFCDFHADISLDEVIQKYRNPDYRFRLSESFTDLPEQGEIINSLFGIPIPLRGADTIFYSGLKKTSTGGLVINLSGKPGAGKTSIALTLAALLSPFNTKCIYISLEEERADLFARLISLVPSYLKELSIYKDPKSLSNSGWFNVTKLSEEVNVSVLTDILKFLAETLDKRKIYHENSIPAICPIYVVIDNINELIAGFKNDSQDYVHLEEFVYQCRKLRAIVVLISADELPSEFRLDYLVDVSIHAKQIGTDNNLNKPLRIFQLLKTRHQISRQGSHIFHLSGAEGFRIAPQIPSQTDKKEKLRRLLADKTRCITTLNILEEPNQLPKYNPYLKIFPNSQILIHGQGSSGKAGLGLKLLLTPPIIRPENFSKVSTIEENYFIESAVFKTDFSQYGYERKVLIISFLYPQDYYEELIDEKIVLSLRKIYKNLKNPKYNPLSFFPGYLTSEDFISKIIRSLDEGILEGEPYTGVLLDGLHNVFLQFKNLQDNDMVWPLLYGILSRYNVTVVSTFTNFRINNLVDSDMASLMLEDQKIMQKGQTPLLHSMVKACDFYITLEEDFHSSDKETRTYRISIRSAIDQNPPNGKLEWDRQSLSIIKAPMANS